MPATYPGNDPALSLIRSGNAEEIAAQYYPIVRSYLRSIVRGSAHDLIETAAADTLLAVSRHGPSFRGRCRITTWVYQIARRKVWTYLQRERADRARLCPLDDPDVVRSVESGAARAPDPIARKAGLEVLAARVSNPAWRRVWLLANDPDLALSTEEVAALTGYTRGSVEVIRSKVRRCLLEASAAARE